MTRPIRRHEKDPEDVYGPLPTIPWPTKTAVEDVSPTSVLLVNGGLIVRVYPDGRTLVYHDTKKEIGLFLKKDEVLTAQLMEYMRDCDVSTPKYFLDCVMDWIVGVPVGPEILRGKKEWRPIENPSRAHYLEDARFVQHRETSSFYDEDWKGDRIEYVRFETDEGDEGIVIMWHLGGDVRGNYSFPEVWIGDVDEFMNHQEESDPENVETLAYYNGYFENGILWMLNELDYFEEHPVEGSWVDEAIEGDPDLLWPELVEKLEDMKDELPKGIQKGLAAWKTRRRREAEKATGQTHLWPGLYPEEDWA